MISCCSVALPACVRNGAVVRNRMVTHVAERVGSYRVWGISYPEDPCVERDQLKRVTYFITHVSGPSQPSPAEAAKGMSLTLQLIFRTCIKAWLIH